MGIFDKLMGNGKKSRTLPNQPHSAEIQFNVELLSADIKRALVGLATTDSTDEIGEQSRNIHALAKVLADALVEKINALPVDAPAVGLGAPALAELVFATSQAEAFAIKSNPLTGSGAPANVQASWLNTVKAAVDDEARALARALATYRYFHGLEP